VLRESREQVKAYVGVFPLPEVSVVQGFDATVVPSSFLRELGLALDGLESHTLLTVTRDLDFSPSHTKSTFGSTPMKWEAHAGCAGPVTEIRAPSSAATNKKANVRNMYWLDA
jgi:hypothetical protein